MATRTPRYTAAPSVAPEQLPRLTAVIEVMAGVSTVSAAARSLGLSRNHFQTILHRAVAAMLASLETHRGGRPPRHPTLTSLQAELGRLRRENRRLRTQVESTEQLLTVAGGLLQGRLRRSGRQARRRTGSGRGEDSADSDGAGRPRLLEAVAMMRGLGVSLALAAGLAGVHPATLRRWRAAKRGCEVVARRKGAARAVASAAAVERVRALVRALHGLVGAESLRHSVAGISRRAAARIKAETLTALERERRAALTRVVVEAPGVLRGIDAMHVRSAGDTLYALISADGATPYRTSLTVGPRYDARLVERALRADLEANGAPLVYRLDRAAAHTAPAARAVLDAHDVLMLQGPPHYPGFYGQLERQNREHRAWIAQLPALSREALGLCLEQMRRRVNDLWRRRSLQWHTATEVWSARPPLVIDRKALRQEVHDRATHIARRIQPGRQPRDLAERLAIIQTLEQMGYLRQEVGGWC